MKKIDLSNMFASNECSVMTPEINGLTLGLTFNVYNAKSPIGNKIISNIVSSDVSSMEVIDYVISLIKEVQPTGDVDFDFDINDRNFMRALLVKNPVIIDEIIDFSLEQGK